MKEMFQFAAKNLGRRRGRTILTILGIVIGVASVVIIGNIAQCGADTLNGEMDSLGLSGLAISASPDAQNVSLQSDDLKTIEKSEQVEQAMPVMIQNAKLQTRNVQEKAIAWGVDQNANRIISLQVLHGRNLNNQDIDKALNVCLVDEEFSKAAYYRSNIVGKSISIICNGTEQKFKVVGVVKTGSGLLQSFMGNYIPSFVYVPYTTLQILCGRSSFDQIAIKIKPGENADKVGKILTQTLSRRSGFKNGYAANNLAKQKDSLKHLTNVITLILSAIGAVSLLVASLSIMTVMLVSVHERTKEIGIKKAIGAKKSTILREFLCEAVLMTVIGALLGASIGTAISYVGAAAYGLKLQPRIDIMIIATIFSLISGIIFGVYPAAKAANLNPIDALRTE